MLQQHMNPEPLVYQYPDHEKPPPIPIYSCPLVVIFGPTTSWIYTQDIPWALLGDYPIHNRIGNNVALLMTS